jgi:hypothetical protein
MVTVSFVLLPFSRPWTGIAFDAVVADARPDMHPNVVILNSCTFFEAAAVNLPFDAGRPRSF